MSLDLHDRINRIINTSAFEETLDKKGSSLIEFQATWSEFGAFDKMPPAFQEAIEAGEQELNSTGVLALI